MTDSRYAPRSHVTASPEGGSPGAEGRAFAVCLAQRGFAPVVVARRADRRAAPHQLFMLAASVLPGMVAVPIEGLCGLRTGKTKKYPDRDRDQRSDIELERNAVDRALHPVPISTRPPAPLARRVARRQLRQALRIAYPAESRLIACRVGRSGIGSRQWFPSSESPLLA